MGKFYISDDRFKFKIVQPLGEQLGSFLKCRHLRMITDNLLVGVYLRIMKTWEHEGLYAVSVEVLLKIANLH